MFSLLNNKHLETPFHSKLANYLSQHDIIGANQVILEELGKALVHHKVHFVEMLNNADVPASVSMSDTDLINLFLKNIKDNKKVRIGAAFLVNYNNKTLGADGESEVSDLGVRSAYTAMTEYWGDYSFANGENHSNGEGIIGSIVEGGFSIGNKVADMQNKKKFGALDALTQQQQAKTALASSVIAQKQAQIEASSKQAAEKAKIKKILIYSSVGLLAVGIGVGVFLYIRKKRKNK